MHGHTNAKPCCRSDELSRNCTLPPQPYRRTPPASSAFCVHAMHSRSRNGHRALPGAWLPRPYCSLSIRLQFCQSSRASNLAGPEELRLSLCLTRPNQVAVTCDEMPFLLHQTLPTFEPSDTTPAEVQLGTRRSGQLMMSLQTHVVMVGLASLAIPAATLSDCMYPISPAIPYQQCALICWVLHNPHSRFAAEFLHDPWVGTGSQLTT